MARGYTKKEDIGLKRFCLQFHRKTLLEQSQLLLFIMI